jgi:hypothetical protein
MQFRGHRQFVLQHSDSGTAFAGNITGIGVERGGIDQPYSGRHLPATFGARDAYGAVREIAAGGESAVMATAAALAGANRFPFERAGSHRAKRISLFLVQRDSSRLWESRTGLFWTGCCQGASGLVRRCVCALGCDSAVELCLKRGLAAGMDAAI